MGYYTGYTLTATACKAAGGRYSVSKLTADQMDALCDAIRALQVFDDPDGFDLEFGIYSFDKWYSWERDMCDLSAGFPGVLFTLHGEGESSDDLWDAYFFEGRTQFCPAKITYDDFDPAKLAPPRELHP